MSPSFSSYGPGIACTTSLLTDGQMLAGLGHDVSVLGVARLYRDILDGLVIDNEDAALAPQIESLGLRVLVTQSIMGGAEDRQRLAEEVLAFADSLRAEH